jgi:glutamate-ammonia-ligase adenylyltransferase
VGPAFPGQVAVVALGKAGSREMTARSDLDLMVLYAAESGAASADKGWRAETVYGRFAQQLTAALSAPTEAGELYGVDLRLRPSGADGPLAVSLPAFEDYFGRDAETWERMALTRARVIWGSTPGFAQPVSAALETAVRVAGHSATVARDVARMRALLEVERPARGPWDMKMMTGGLVDVEFAAQLLQLTGGPLRPGTVDAIEAAAQVGCLPQRTAETLIVAWRLQAGLSQLIAVALEPGTDPAAEPEPFRRKLVRAGGARSFSALEGRLRRTQMEARRAWSAVITATESRQLLR